MRRLTLARIRGSRPRSPSPRPQRAAPRSTRAATSTRGSRSVALSGKVHARVVLPRGLRRQSARGAIPSSTSCTACRRTPTAVPRQRLDRRRARTRRPGDPRAPAGRAQRRHAIPSTSNWGAGRNWETYVADGAAAVHRRALPHDPLARRAARSSASQPAATARRSWVCTISARSRVIESWSGYFHPTDPTGTRPLCARAGARARTPLGDLARVERRRRRSSRSTSAGATRGSSPRTSSSTRELAGDARAARVRRSTAARTRRSLWQTHAVGLAAARAAASRARHALIKRLSHRVLLIDGCSVVQPSALTHRPGSAPGRRAGARHSPRFVAVGLIGAYRYVDNYWLYRGFPPPHDASFVRVRGHDHSASTSRAPRSADGGSRSTSISRPATRAHPRRRYPVALSPARRSRDGPARSSRPCVWASSRMSSSRFTARSR